MGETASKTLSDTPPASKGYTTTEFWKHLALQIMLALSYTGVIKPDSGQKYDALIQAVSAGAAAVSLVGYAISRAITKAAAVKAAALALINSTKKPVG